jgi:hypothetical protein
MIKIELEPLKGIKIANIGELRFGQSRLMVETILGKPTRYLDQDQFLYEDYELRIDFDQDSISFIEFIYGPYPEKTELQIYGINPFAIGADNLIQLLSNKNDGEIDDSEAGYCYAFLNISVGVWRQATEQNIQESIDNARLNGSNEDQIRQLMEELESVKNFWTIGIGKTGYYSEIPDEAGSGPAFY